MSITQALVPHLPSLRRFARALSGSQKSGDAYVVALVEALVENPSMFATDTSPKIALYRLFLKVWNSVGANAFLDMRHQSDVLDGVEVLTPRPRQALLLLLVEGLTPGEVAEVMDVDAAEVASLIAEADLEIANQLDPAGILIIEDEPITALHLETLVRGLAHHVTGVARTHKEALALVKECKPELILSDIRLADGSSGIDAVNEMLKTFEVPVIFVTGHPELLLTGAKPEPTFLIAKPFNPETLGAIIGQALFFKVRSQASVPHKAQAFQDASSSPH